MFSEACVSDWLLEIGDHTRGVHRPDEAVSDFRKKAAVPCAQSSDMSVAELSWPEEVSDEDAVPVFSKRALPPPPSFAACCRAAASLPLLSLGPRAKSERNNVPSPANLAILHRAKAGIQEFVSRTLRSVQIYSSLKKCGVAMDIIHLVEVEGVLDETRFQTHTAPNTSSTALRYARLMEKFLDWWFSLNAQDRETVSERDRHAQFGLTRRAVVARRPGTQLVEN